MMKPTPVMAPSRPNRLARISGSVMSATYALATARLACIAPLIMRTTTSTHSAPANAVPKKLMQSPMNPISSIGLRPY